MAAALREENLRGRRMRARYNPNMAMVYPNTRIRQRAPWLGIGEMKWISINITGNNNLTGTVGALSTIPHGATSGSREGKKAVILGIQIKGVIVAGTTQATPRRFRFDIWKEKHCRGALPAVTDVLTTDAGAERLPNNDGVGRFKLMWHKNGYINAEGDTLTGTHPCYMINTFRKMKHVVEWEHTDTAGAYADIIHGGLFYIMGGSGTDDTTSPSYNVNLRVFFKDI